MPVMEDEKMELIENKICRKMHSLTNVVKSKKSTREDVSAHWIFAVYPPI